MVRWWWPWGAFAASILLGLVVALWFRAVQPAEVAGTTLAFTGGVFGLFASLGFWSWRRLAELHARSDEPVIYRVGVRRFGVAMWIGLSLLLALMVDRQRPEGGMLTPEFGLELLMRLIINAPIALWTGYLLGRTMARLQRGDGRK